MLISEKTTVRQLEKNNGEKSGSESRKMREKQILLGLCSRYVYNKTFW